jgi:tRNA A37 threonylcarbamoyladenosine dehydratase
MDHYERRFGGIGRLYGTEGLERIRRAHVCVVGLGGVGSWAVEALARSGIGALTLVDLDDVCISNVNRQLHALDGELGKPKVEVMARRVRAINPDCVVHPLQAFFLKSNAQEILQAGFDYMLDAFDSPSRKCVLIAQCRERSIPVITSGAAAGRRDPTSVEVIDLAFSSHDRLLQEVRSMLRTRHGFPRGQHAFGVECVLSRERVVYPKKDGLVCAAPGPEQDLRIDCDTGFGTASYVTGTFGFVAASRIIQRIVEGRGGGSPKSEIRDPKEGRSPKSEAGMRGTGHEAFSGGDCLDAR